MVVVVGGHDGTVAMGGLYLYLRCAQLVLCDIYCPSHIAPGTGLQPIAVELWRALTCSNCHHNIEQVDFKPARGK